MNISEAQFTFLQAWKKSHPDELHNMLTSMGYSPNYTDLSSSQANTVLAAMTAEYGQPKSGTDADKHNIPEGHNTDGNLPDADTNSENENDGENNNNGGDDGESDSDDAAPENPYREGSKEQIIAQALIDNNLSVREAFEQIADQIGQEPLVFEGNIGGGRAPLPMGDRSDKSSEKTQNGRAKKTINDVRRNLLKNESEKKKNKENGNDDGDAAENENGSGSGSNNGQPEIKYEAEILLENLHDARAICERMNADGDPFDTIGLRPFVHGPKMLMAGFSRLAVLDAMTMAWPREVRRELNGGSNLPVYDQRKFPKTKPIVPMPIDLIEQRLEPLREKTNGRSLYLPAMIALAETGTPILQIGEKGTGKTTNAEHLALALAERWDRPMPFGFASMTSGTSPGEFRGRITLDGFLQSLFCEIYENGGVYLFDEIDAGDENLLTMLNSALANGYFVNQKGDVIRMSEHFVPVAAANTMGLGATSRYTGRNRLDAATLDRWAMGRVRVEFDVHLAEFIYWNNLRAATVAA